MSVSYCVLFKEKSLLGKRVESRNCGWMTAVGNKYPVGASDRKSKIDVKFDNGFVRKGVPYQNFLLGAVSDGSVWDTQRIYNTTFHTGRWGDVDAVFIKNMKNISVRFLDTGNKQVEPFDPLVKGLIVDRVERDKRLNADEDRKQAWREQEAIDAPIRAAKVEEQRLKAQQREDDIKGREVERQNKILEQQQAMLENEELNKLNIKKVITPKTVVIQSKDLDGVLDVDFKDRDGNWVLRFRDPSKCKFIQTRIGKMHNNMTQRASAGSSYQGVFGSYKGVTTSAEFADAQKFGDWVVQQVGWGLGFSLDKDLLVDGNREYSSRACCLLPHIINYAIMKLRKDAKCTFITATAKGTFKVTCQVSNTKIKLGEYSSWDEALDAYCKYREKYVRKLADEYSTFISKEAYKALMEWRLV